MLSLIKIQVILFYFFFCVDDQMQMSKHNITYEVFHQKPLLQENVKHLCNIKPHI